MSEGPGAADFLQLQTPVLPGCRDKFHQSRNARRAMIENLRKISHKLLDFVFGAARPHPETLEVDSEAAWQRWLTAGIEAEEVQPQRSAGHPLHD